MTARGARIRVLIADDHPMFREGVALAVERHRDLELIAACDDGAVARAAIEQLEPDVAVLDLQLPGATGLEIVRGLPRDLSTRCVLLSGYTEGALVHEALAVGAFGYLSKDADRSEICEAICAVARGETALSDELKDALVGEVRIGRQNKQVALTTREHEVLTLVADGHSTPVIARKLYLGETSVKTYVRRVFDKLEVSDRPAAVAEAMRRGFLR